MLERVADAGHQPFRADRLHHKVISAKAHRVDRDFDGAFRCRDDHADGAGARHEALERLQPPHVRQIEVQDDDAWRLLLDFYDALGAAGGRRDAKAGALQKGAVYLRDRRNVFDNQDSIICFLHHPGRAANWRSPFSPRAAARGFHNPFLRFEPESSRRAKRRSWLKTSSLTTLPRPPDGALDPLRETTARAPPRHQCSRAPKSQRKAQFRPPLNLKLSAFRASPGSNRCRRQRDHVPSQILR